MTGFKTCFVQSVFFFFAIWPFIMHAQEHNTGIQWTRELSWEQVKQKAKQENKYIFLDCQATWCTPCKMMDKQVFPIDSVGDFFSRNFIAVSVQMDVTNHDASHVQAWYKDAQAIAKEYRVDGFPSFLFFNPSGELVEKEAGFMPAGRFLTLCRTALEPGKIYKDPLVRYYKLMERYNTGHKDYDSMYYMFEKASQLGDVANAVLLSIDLDRHLEGMPLEKLLTRERIEYIERVTTSVDSKWFWLFYKYSKKINEVMKADNYAQGVIDGIILNTVAYPYLKMPTPALMIASGRVKVNLAEADWKGLEEKIRRQLNSYYAKRNTMLARIFWYKWNWNLVAFASTYYDYLDKYGAGGHPWVTPRIINDFSYNDVFLPINDSKILKQAVRRMKQVVDQDPKNFRAMDTYASLLYKAGFREKAIPWEEKALQTALTVEHESQEIPFFRSALEKMKRGEKLNWFD